MTQFEENKIKHIKLSAVLLTVFAALYFACGAICYSGTTQAQFTQSNDGFWKSAWWVFALFLYGSMLLWTAYCVWSKKYLFLQDKRSAKDVVPFLYLALGTLCVRIVLSLFDMGYDSDVACFQSWGRRLAQVGCSQFYAPDYFCDYPPGYLYILALCSKLCTALGFADHTSMSVMVYKLPAMLCDIGIAYLFYRRAKAKYGHLNGMLAACMVLFSPNIWVDSAIWGQVDSVWMLPMVACLFALEDEKILPACLLYTASLLVKPQALMLAPVLLVYAVFYVIRHKWQGVVRGAVAMAVSCAVFVLVTLPFASQLGYAVIWDKYFGTMTSYPYITLNAPNFYYFFGLNVSDISREFLGLSFRVWTTLGIFLSAALAAFVYYKNRDNRPLVLSCTVLLCALFMFGPAMHERYLYPAALVCSYLAWDRGEKFWQLIACAMSCVSFIAMTCVLRVMHFPGGYPAGLLACALNLVTFAVLVYFALKAEKLDQTSFVRPQKKSFNLQCKLRTVGEAWCAEQKAVSFGWKKMDTVVILILTTIYSLAAFTNLGDTKWPQTYWEPQQAGQYYVLDLGEEQSVGYINILEGVGDGAVQFFYSSDGEFYQVAGEPWSSYYASFLSWSRVEYEFDAHYIRLLVTQPGLRIHELGVFTKDGEQLTIQSFETEAQDAQPFANAVDEQDLVPVVKTYENSSYFDEVYHARTALEQINGWPIYEQTHPPLGKILISLGIRLFGLSPFAWRFMGSLAGVLMIPAMYLFGKLLFKKTRWAALSASLMCLDFMHYTQTRIATIDSFSVLFIILMYLFMYIFLQEDFYSGKKKKAYIALALSGIFFGIGAATKWICIYAGAGLAVLFFLRLVKEFFAYRAAKAVLQEHQQEDALYLYRASKIVGGFWKKVFFLVGFCLLFFVLIPCVIYVLSYIPYIGTAGQPEELLSIVWQNQQYIFKYHSDYVLDQVEIHPYQSAWYTWPFIGRPIFYYMGEYLPYGTVAGISAFGNPAIWWFGIFALGWMCLTVYLKKHRVLPLQEDRTDHTRLFILLALAAQFLPWVFVTRSTYIYHYFASTPFLMLCIVCFFCDMQNLHADHPAARIAPWAYTALCAVLFILFYPLITGIPVSASYAEFCRWMPGWVLYSYWQY
ncbi:MAG: glycosyltransferase family 39 protein [Clostridia bacterium]|nr:glycosyltransferase family 39 protein [Clostridia bacterium]